MNRILRAVLCSACPIMAALPFAAQDTQLAAREAPTREARNVANTSPAPRVVIRQRGTGVSDGRGNVPELTAKHDAAHGTIVFSVERGLGGTLAALFLGEGLVTRFTRRPQQLVHPALAVLWLPLSGAAGDHGAGEGSLAVPLPRDLATATLRAQVRIVDPRTSVTAWSRVLEIRVGGRGRAQK